jgi:predicted nucleotidyltransferase
MGESGEHLVDSWIRGEPPTRRTVACIAVDTNRSPNEMSKLSPPNLPRVQLASFCDRWGIVELAIFGSAVRGELRADSDLDILISFDPESPISLLDLAEMELELEEICDREVEIVTRRSVEASTNSIRRKEILESAQPIIQRPTRESGSVVWTTVTRDIPQLLEDVERITDR